MSYDDDLRHGDRQMIATFGRPIRLPKGDSVLAVFDEPYTRTDLPDGGFVQGKVITLTLMATDADSLSSRDVVSVPRGKALTPDGGITWDGWTDFSVREVQPDGAGLLVVYLDPVTGSNNSAYSVY
ncbi:head-tail joining protein [Serratia rhizosphaerae]